MVDGAKVISFTTESQRTQSFHREISVTFTEKLVSKVTRTVAEEMKNEQQVQSFESSLEALEKIVQQLENGDLPLEKSLELFEQGIKLSRQCQERLSQAERRIEVLLRDNQGRPVVSTFDDAQISASASANSNDEDVF